MPDCRDMKNENKPTETSIAPAQVIKLNTRFGGCSRGKCWGKYFANKTTPTGGFDWVEKSNGNLFLSGPGYYIVGSSDGFSRDARAEFYIAPATVAAPNVSSNV